jgi:hypothetical protein
VRSEALALEQQQAAGLQPALGHFVPVGPLLVDRLLGADGPFVDHVVSDHHVEAHADVLAVKAESRPRALFFVDRDAGELRDDELLPAPDVTLGGAEGAEVVGHRGDGVECEALFDLDGVPFIGTVRSRKRLSRNTYRLAAAWVFEKVAPRMARFRQMSQAGMHHVKVELFPVPGGALRTMYSFSVLASFSRTS